MLLLIDALLFDIANIPNDPNALSHMVTGVLVVVGLTVAGIVAIGGIILGILDRRMKQQMLLFAADNTMPFALHGVDPDAHGPMQRRLQAEWGQKLDQIDKNHHETLQAFMEMIKPIVEENVEAMRIMRTQMRRQGPRDDGE